MGLVTTTTRFTFRGVHSLNTGALKEQCHGHQYFLEVTTSLDQRGAVELQVHKAILPALDRHDLTKILPITTGEMLVEWIHDRVEALCGEVIGVALQETRKNRFVSRRSDAALL